MRITSMATIAAAVAAATLQAPAAWGLSAADKCEAAKLKATGKYGLCRLAAEAKAVKTGSAADFTKCEDKFSDKWGSAESHAGGMCPSTGDEAAIRGFVVLHAADVAAALDGGPLANCPGDLTTCNSDLSTCNASLLACIAQPSGQRLTTGQLTCYSATGTPIACAGTGQDGDLQKGLPRVYVDNGDGTMTDTRTGLMWEKLSDDGSIHDWNIPYTWINAINTKIATLNSASFAGHNDWRLPNVNELQSLVSYGGLNPAINPAFYSSCSPGCTVTTCSCTSSLLYWTSTTYRDDPTSAWIVDFYLGIVTSSGKFFNEYVRAVRDAS